MLDGAADAGSPGRTSARPSDAAISSGNGFVLSASLCDEHPAAAAFAVHDSRPGLNGISFALHSGVEVILTMLDRTRETISTGDLQRLKDDPDHVDGRRWIPLLVAEIERLRELLKDLKN